MIVTEDQIVFKHVYQLMRNLLRLLLQIHILSQTWSIIIVFIIRASKSIDRKICIVWNVQNRQTSRQRRLHSRLCATKRVHGTHASAAPTISQHFWRKLCTTCHRITYFRVSGLRTMGANLRRDSFGAYAFHTSVHVQVSKRLHFRCAFTHCEPSELQIVWGNSATHVRCCNQHRINPLEWLRESQVDS